MAIEEDVVKVNGKSTELDELTRFEIDAEIGRFNSQYFFFSYNYWMIPKGTVVQVGLAMGSAL